MYDLSQMWRAVSDEETTLQLKLAHSETDIGAGVIDVCLKLGRNFMSVDGLGY